MSWPEEDEERLGGPDEVLPPPTPPRVKAPSARIKVYAPRKPLPPAEIPSFLEYEFRQLTEEFGFKAGSIRGCPVVYVDYPAFRFIVKPKVDTAEFSSISLHVPRIEFPVIKPIPIVHFIIRQDDKEEDVMNSPCLEPAGFRWTMSTISAEVVEGKIKLKPGLREIPVSEFLSGAVSMKATVEDFVEGAAVGLAFSNILGCFFYHLDRRLSDEKLQKVAEHLANTTNIPCRRIMAYAYGGIPYIPAAYVSPYTLRRFDRNAESLRRIDVDKYTRCNVAYIKLLSNIPLFENNVSLKDILSLPYMDERDRDLVIYLAVSSAIYSAMRPHTYPALPLYVTHLAEKAAEMDPADAAKMLFEAALSLAKKAVKKLKVKIDMDKLQEHLSRIDWLVIARIGSPIYLENAFDEIHDYEPLRRAVRARIEELIDVPKLVLDEMFLADDWVAHGISKYISRHLYSNLYDSFELFKRRLGYEFELAP